MPCCCAHDILLLSGAGCKRSMLRADEGLTECLTRGSDRRGRRGSILRAPGSILISQWADRSSDAPRRLYVPWKPRVYPIKERTPSLPRNPSLFLVPPSTPLSAQSSSQPTTIHSFSCIYSDMYPPHLAVSAFPVPPTSDSDTSRLPAYRANHAARFHPYPRGLRRPTEAVC